MKPSKHFHRLAALAACALLVAAGPASARSSHKPAPAQPAQAEQPAPEPAGVTGYGIKLGGFFSEQQKKAARNYFAQRYNRGKDCPPGMERNAKKCAPPVEGRYWAVGQALQPAVTVHPVPEPALAKLPAPPSGYEYVMAGDDILLVSKGLHLVVDMIEDVMG